MASPRAALLLWAAALAACPAATGAGGAVFGGDVDFSLVSINLVGIIVFTLIFEGLTEALEEAVEDSALYLDMVTKVYKELMILGVLSFILALSVEFGVHVPPAWLHSFEWAHMIIFAVAGLYLGNAIVAIVAMEATFAEWVRSQNKSVKTTVDDLQAAHANGDGDWREGADFKIIRLVFLSEYSLPKVFDYMSYVKRKLHANVRHTVHIAISTWIVVAVLCGLIAAGVWGFRVTIDDREPLPNATDDDSHRRQLGGGGGAAQCTTMYECETELTARLAVATTGLFSWTFLVLQSLIVLLLNKKWDQVFEAKGIPIGPGADAESMAVALKDWQRKVDVANIVSKADFDERSRNDAVEGQDKVTLMVDLQEIYSESTEIRMQKVSQTIQVLNCLCMAIYAVHLRKVIHLPVAQLPVPFLFDLLVVLPSLILVLKLIPLGEKKAALLGAMVRQDVELVAEVFAFTEEVRALRNKIQKVLVTEAQNLALLSAKAKGEEAQEEEMSAEESARVASKQMFDSFNTKGSSLSYDEIRRGLATISVSMTNREFADVMNLVRFYI